MKKLILILPAIILAVSCSKRVPVSVPLVLPAELILPAVPGSMECLSQETYQALVTRDELQAQRRKTLRAIIETTHEGVGE